MNCPHHIQWIVPVTQGLHQCLQCTEVVTKKDVTPKFEDLGPEIQKRWDAHEAAAKPPAPAPVPAAAPPSPAGG
ncbi:MAG TPA: hypothetical protein VIV59_11890 [Anaeromyxobacteraceae bacterium]